MNGVLRLWEVPSGKLLGERPLDGDGVTRFSPDGRVVAAAANLGVRLLDGDTLAPLPAGYLPHPDPITDVAFSPDGAFLLTAHETGSAQLWDVATRKPVGPPAVLIGPIRAVTFTPDGKTCLCVAADGTVRRWPVPAPFAEPDLARLADRVALMTGQRMDDNQGLDSVPADEWQCPADEAGRRRQHGPGPAAAGRRLARRGRRRRRAGWRRLRGRVAPRPAGRPAAGRLDHPRPPRPRPGARPAGATRPPRPTPPPGRWPRPRRCWPTGCGPPPRTTRRPSGTTKGWWNLDRAVELTPDDWTLYATRAALADLAGHPDRAAADVDEAIRLGAEPSVIASGRRSRAAGPATGSGRRPFLTAIARDPAFPIEARYRQAVRLSEGRRQRRLPGRVRRDRQADARRSARGCRGRGERRGLGLRPRSRRPPTTGPSRSAWIDHALARLAAAEKANPAAKDQIQPSRHVFLQHPRGGVVPGRPVRGGGEGAPGGDGASTRKTAAFQDWLFLALAEHRLGHADAAKEAAAKARAALRGASAGSVWDQGRGRAAGRGAGLRPAAPGPVSKPFSRNAQAT